MDENLEETVNSEIERVEIEELEILSLKKFVILSILTATLYQAWWVYKAWRFFKQRENSDIQPALRTIFGIFYLIPLFNKVQNYALEKGYQDKYNSVGLYIGAVAFNMASRLPHPLWILSGFCFVFFIYPVMAFSYGLENDEEIIVTRNDNYSTRQVVICVLGGIFWFMVITALLFPEE